MAFDPELAETRFGTGLGPDARPLGDAGAMLDRLAGPDRAARAFPIGRFDDQIAPIRKAKQLNKAARKGDEAARADFKRLRKELTKRHYRWFAATLARHATSADGLRERLTRFWEDHFTVVAKTQYTRFAVSTFAEDAIRPHLTGNFADMLRAAVTHWLMLDYLDQFASVAEDSIVGMRRGKGLNENLAREVLELHTLGVGSGYSQRDVREFAKLLTGFTHDKQGRAIFFPRRGSPGAETVLGRSYGGEIPKLGDVFQALDDLARHPDTAHHLARKLVVHFVSEEPDPALVAHVSAAYSASGGALLATYRALLEHPLAWEPRRAKAKPPFDFIASALRALGLEGKAIMGLKRNLLTAALYQPLRQMGQPWQRPTGPDGWSETRAHWITPQGLAARIQWGQTAPLALMRAAGQALPDPRDLAGEALGSMGDETLHFAARAAETRWEGVGLVLAAPGFQMR